MLIEPVNPPKKTISCRSSPDQTFRGELPLELTGGAAEIALDYVKKEHVFRLKLSSGGDYLLQCADDEEMNLWINSVMRQAAGGL